jgi:choice-of-anchor B domain-containing protein
MKIIVISRVLLLIFSYKKSVALEYTPPQIVSGNTGIDLIENSCAGQTVYIIKTTGNVEVIGYFLSGPDADFLTLNSNTVSLDANPDFEIKSSYSFEVTVNDAEGNISEIQMVTFSIIDVDETPAFVLDFCENGFAGEYPCNNYNLIGHIDLNTLGANSGNDCWGWTDLSSGKEYALMGLNTGTSFIDISDLEFPRIVGFLPAHTTNSIWRDIKTYGNYAFIVSEAPGHGMQVFDLTKLVYISANQPPQTFTPDAHYNGFGDAHNIVINDTQGYAYAFGTSTYSGGPHFIDISNPLNPSAAGGYGEDAYSHDAQVVTYNGPDTDYTGKEILIGSNENEVVIVDVTDKINPTQIATINYPNIEYTHQGWFTEDQSYFILGDELDEHNFGGNTRNIMFDFTDLDAPSIHMNYYGPTTAIDHNGYVIGDDYYLANYSAGIRIIDITNISNETMAEIGYFDTYPSNDNASFNEVWSVYPYFSSGNIIISDRNSGFYIVRKSE